MSLRYAAPTRLSIALAPLAFLAALIALLAAPPAAGAPAYEAESDLIEVMFAPESRVRMRSEELIDLSTNALDGLAVIVRDAAPIAWSRISDVPEPTLDDIEARGEAATGENLYNLNNIYRLRFNGATTDVWTLSARLEALPGILLARPVPKPAPAPFPPDYQPIQNYEDPALAIPTGVDAEYAWTQAGGSGAGITICDLEYSWNYNHNDVTKAVGSQINVNVADPFNDPNHGTAVIGELVSDDNLPNWGTKGVSFGANLRTCGTYYGLPAPSWNVPGALAVAIANLNAGDVILLEQQWPYTNGGTDYIPIEWWTDYAPGPQTLNGVYAAIQNAVAVGIHVVEAGGNGNVNTGLLTWFGDSGAIIVGAGGAYAGGTWPQGNLERLSFSSYGPRFNLQGWGENVVTTGYGNLFNLEGPLRWYTNTFDGTSSASPIVAGAVACVQGYYLANISPVPLAPGLMRTLLVNTGTPQFFGLPGNIGPRPDCRAAIAALSTQQFEEYGDAPEGALAYPNLGVIGRFPTCVASGAPGSFVRHGVGGALPVFFGPTVDYENEGNAGNCPNFPPYDADECWNDGDAGLLFPPAYTINAALQVVPCNPPNTGCLGPPCTLVQWGPNLDLIVTNMGPTAFVNVLMDWDQNGFWGGALQCPTGVAPEHVLVNFPVPGGFVGPLSALGPPPFLTGPFAGYVWTRFMVSEAQVPLGWTGSGVFERGETCDYLLCIEEERREYGDAPEGATAYPGSGVIGAFPTCTGVGPAGFIAHQSTGLLFFGPTVDLEPDGNAGNCPNFPPYDADECWNDGDSGLLAPGAFTIGPGLAVVPCMGAPSPLGNACTMANWGPAADIQVTNTTAQDAYVNVLMDWDQNGRWQGGSPCPIGTAPEHMLVNFIVPAGFAGPLSALAPPAFLIGPNAGHVWSRWTVSDAPVVANWDGSGVFHDGETSDYLVEIRPDVRIDYADAPEGALAYPAAGTIGFFPTCMNVGPAGFVMHQASGRLFLGPIVDAEPDGNAGLCPLFQPYDADECWNDGDAGLLIPSPYTIDGSFNVVPCPQGPGAVLGLTCNTAIWGANLDLQVTNTTPGDAFVNVLMDWNQDGRWQGGAPCPTGAAPEHVLVDFVVPAGFSGPLALLAPPPFLIGPRWDHVWSRFTISDARVGPGWNGEGSFGDGETSDYLLEIRRDVADLEGEAAPIVSTRLLAPAPNPFFSATTIGLELAQAGAVSLGVYDVAGRQIRTLVAGERSAGRYQITWDGRNDAGARVASGMYFVRLTSEGRTSTRPLLLAR
jgi:hypothetical protein